MKRRAAFLDRDGVLNVRPPAHQYVQSVADFEWLPGAVAGASRLARAGYVLAVVSNQRGVARGLVEMSTLADIEAQIQAQLLPHGVQIERFMYCTHERDEGCTCRKPSPGMLLSLADELELDLPRSWMIGDSPCDVIAGQRAGCATALISDDRLLDGVDHQPELVVSSLHEASDLILG